MKILHIDASSKFHQWSNSRALGRFFLEQLKEGGVEIELDYLDVTADIQPHVSAEFAQATYTPEDQRTPEMRAVLMHSDAMCQRVMEADVLVCAMPMYNWTIPSTFKTFIDTITRTGVTYELLSNGTTVGKLGDKKVVFITTRGADLREGSPYSAMDAMTPVLKTSFSFIGVDAPTFIDVQPLQFTAAEERDAALVRAHDELSKLAAQWAIEYGLNQQIQYA